VPSVHWWLDCRTRRKIITLTDVWYVTLPRYKQARSYAQFLQMKYYFIDWADWANTTLTFGKQCLMACILTFQKKHMHRHTCNMLCLRFIFECVFLHFLSKVSLIVISWYFLLLVGCGCDWLETRRLVSDVIYNVLLGLINLTHSLTHSLNTHSLTHFWINHTESSAIADKPRDAFCNMQWRCWAPKHAAHNKCYHVEFRRSTSRRVREKPKPWVCWGHVPVVM